MSGTGPYCPPAWDAGAGALRRDRLATLPFLKALQGTTRAAVVKALTLCTAEKHEQIIHERASADSVYLIIDGAVMAWKQRGPSDTQVTGFLFRGDLLGTLIGERYLYSARAVVACQLAQMARTRLAELADRHPDLRHALYGQVTSDFALAQDHLSMLGALSADERLASALLQFERRQRARGVAEGVPVWVPMRRTDLASYLGLELPTLSRVFGRLRRDGVISTPSTTDIKIHERDTLMRLSGDA